MSLPKSTFKWKNYTITSTWIKSISLESFSPITQIYGICFNDRGKILVCRELDKSWQLPGGTPEPSESPEETLRRELLEEVNVKVKNIKPLGVQKVEFPGNPNKDEGEVFYQARYVCQLDKLLPLTPDSATGETWERKFVPADQIVEYIKWGDVGEAMFKDAIEKFKSLTAATS